MAAAGITIGDLLADSGYAYRTPESWALPLRRLGARLVQDLHPNDRGPNGTHMGAICANGNLYCPATPKTLLELSPLRPAQTQNRSPRTTKRPPSSPTTSSRASQVPTATATSASPAPPARAGCAARRARRR